MEPYSSLEVSHEPSPYEDIVQAGVPSKWVIKWKDLELSDTLLGKGNFGEVRKGVYRIGDRELEVAVKTLYSKIINLVTTYQKLTILNHLLTEPVTVYVCRNMHTASIGSL